MRRAPHLLPALVVLAATTGWCASRADDDSRAVVVAAMRRVFTGQDPPLIQKAAAGKASDVEKKRLLTVLTGMADTRPEKGSVEAWKERTAALASAAQDLVDGKEGAGDRLRAASDCRACHQAHRPNGDK